jgi:hypothetical protein
MAMNTDIIFSILPTVPPRTPTITRVLSEAKYRQIRIAPLLCPAQLVSEAATFTARHTDAHVLDLERTLGEFFDLSMDDYYGSNQNRRSSARANLVITTATRKHQPLLTDWHRDCNPHYHFRRQIYHRYVMMMLGPRTLILENDSTIRAVTADPDYKINSSTVLDAQPRIAIVDRQIYRLKSGIHDPQIHSVPHLTLDRVFISVIYH